MTTPVERSTSTFQGGAQVEQGGASCVLHHHPTPVGGGGGAEQVQQVFEVEREVEQPTRSSRAPGAILGIDPGVTGALCLLRPDGSADLRDIPTLDVKPRRTLDLHALAAILREWADESPTVWIELVGPRPTDGSVAAFSFGGMFWGLKAMAASYAFPLETVAPVRWRRAMGLPAGDGKDASRARASNLLPRLAHHWPLVKHDGRAEAALIALYGQRQAAHQETAA